MAYRRSGVLHPFSGGLARFPVISVSLADLLPSKNRSRQTGKPWARHALHLTFQGVECVGLHTAQVKALKDELNIDTVAPGLPMPEAVLDSEDVAITHARMAVQSPGDLPLLKQNVDQDIKYNSTTGIFVICLRTRVGSSVVQPLIERVARVERLVEFMSVLRKHKATLTCESASLAEIVFTYELPPSTLKDGEEAPGASEVRAGATEPVTYKSRVDFGTNGGRMAISFEAGNPHIRVLDSLNAVLNASLGLDGVANELFFTLPVLSALDTIERAWGMVSCEHGEVQVLVRSLDHYMVRYTVLDRRPGSPPKLYHKITISAKLRARDNEGWWLVNRSGDQERHAIDDILDPVWSGRGEGWRGLRTSAGAKGPGIHALLCVLDESLRQWAINGPSTDATAAQDGSGSAAEMVNDTRQTVVVLD